MKIIDYLSIVSICAWSMSSIAMDIDKIYYVAHDEVVEEQVKLQPMSYDARLMKLDLLLHCKKSNSRAGYAFTLPTSIINMSSSKSYIEFGDKTKSCSCEKKSIITDYTKQLLQSCYGNAPLRSTIEKHDGCKKVQLQFSFMACKNVVHQKRSLVSVPIDTTLLHDEEDYLAGLALYGEDAYQPSQSILQKIEMGGEMQIDVTFNVALATS